MPGCHTRQEDIAIAGVADVVICSLRGRHDLLIASDVLYERESGMVLAAYKGRLLSHRRSG